MNDMENVDTDLLGFYFKQKDEVNSLHVNTETKVGVEKNVATVIITLEHKGHWRKHGIIYKLDDEHTIYNLMTLMSTNFYLLQTIDFLKGCIDEKKEENEGPQEADANSS